jgi:type III secretion protein U
MGQNDASGEKTHQPTQQRLRDARQQGQVAHSQDLTRSVVLASAAVALLVFGHSAFAALRALAERAWRGAGSSSLDIALQDIGAASALTLAVVGVPAVAWLAVSGALSDFAQAGPLWAMQRIAPDFSRLNPADGLKRIFSLNNLVETGKALLKTALLFGLFAVLGRRWIGELLALPGIGVAGVATAGQVFARLLLELLGSAAALFVLLSFGDLQWQRFQHRRKLRMSTDEVKRERKEHDGDPQLKGQRRQLQRRWASQDLIGAARRASALVINPTHIAVALEFDAAASEPPSLTAKGHGAIARAMREAARDAGVPIVRNVALARALDRDVEIDEAIPEDLFDAVAEVLVWAQQLRQQQAAGATANDNRPPPDDEGLSS